jgi:hypothetical protein
MGEHRHEALCPACGGTLADDSEFALIKKVQGHAKEKHGIDMTEKKARSLFKEAK